MIAAKHRKHPFAVRELAALYIFNLGTVYSYRNIVFGLTCDSACMTSDALPPIH